MYHSREILAFVLASGVALAITGSAGDARATSYVTCTVTSVAWATGGGGTFQVICGGNWYYAFGSSSTCPTVSLDARKAWQSLAQSAFLSGKPLYIEYSTCTGGRAMTYARLTN